jgi:hypothetical protein
VATGKVKSYSFSVDGDSGKLVGSITLGCTVGRDGSFVETAGTPVYVDAGYVDVGYQVYSGQTHELDAGAGGLGWEDYTEQPIDDDGVDLTDINPRDYILSCTVTGGQETQQEAVAPNALNKFGSVKEVVERLSAVTTTVSMQLKPVTGGPFETNLAPVVSQLTLPRMIDLEAT